MFDGLRCNWYSDLVVGIRYRIEPLLQEPNQTFYDLTYQYALVGSDRGNYLIAVVKALPSLGCLLIGFSVHSRVQLDGIAYDNPDSPPLIERNKASLFFTLNRET